MYKVILTSSDTAYLISIYACCFDGSFDGPAYYLYNFGILLLSFFKINLNEFVNIINFPMGNPQNTDQSYKEIVSLYIEKCFYLLSNAGYCKVISALILNELERVLLTADRTEEYISDKFNDIFRGYAAMQMVLNRYFSKEISKAELNEKLIPILQGEVIAKHLIAPNGNIHLYFMYDDIFSLLGLEIINVQKNNINIKKCENCGDFFIPQKRSDEKYCDRIHENGKTCKQLGYSIKEKNDPFKREFTKARKTQHARIRYNEHIKDYKEKHYLPWLEAAQKAKKEYENSGDIDGFCKWLEENKNSF